LAKVGRTVSTALTKKVSVLLMNVRNGHTVPARLIQSRKDIPGLG
jgi:hypothetical protein